MFSVSQSRNEVAISRLAATRLTACSILDLSRVADLWSRSIGNSANRTPRQHFEYIALPVRLFTFTLALLIHGDPQGRTNGYANGHANRNVVQGCSNSSAQSYSEGHADTDATALSALGLLVILIAHSLTSKLKQ
jgi:hypothetical protein